MLSEADDSGRPQPALFGEYHPDAPERSAAEAARVEAALGLPAGAVEHVGSTAVPGFGGKPTIDLLMPVAGLPPTLAMVETLASIGYEHRPQRSEPARHYFRKGTTYPRDFNLHLAVPGSRPWIELIAFRDHQRKHPADAERYEAVKRRAAADPSTYRATKTRLYREILDRALKGR